MAEPTITVRGQTYERGSDGLWYWCDGHGNRLAVPTRFSDVIDALHAAWSVPRAGSAVDYHDTLAADRAAALRGEL